MRLPRVRFTVRTMMVMVAAVALTTALGMEARRLHGHYRERTEIAARYAYADAR